MITTSEPVNELTTVGDVVRLIEAHADGGTYALTTGQILATAGHRRSRISYLIRTARRDGRIAVRRVRVGPDRRRTWIALPQHAHHLPPAGGAR